MTTKPLAIPDVAPASGQVQVQARVNPYGRVVPETDLAGQLLSALSGVAGVAADVAGKQAQIDLIGEKKAAAEQKFAQKQFGATAAMRDRAKTQDAAIMAIPANSTNEFAMEYMKTTGVAHGAEFAQALEEHLRASLDPENPDPAKAEQAVREFYGKHTEGLSDAHYAEGFNAVAFPAMSKHLAAVRDLAQDKLARDSDENVLKAHSQFLMVPGAYDAAAVQTSLAAARAMNRPYSAVEPKLFEQMAEAAENAMNLSFFEAWNVRGPDGQPSFAEREPKKYNDALQRVRANIERRSKQAADVEHGMWLARREAVVGFHKANKTAPAQDQIETMVSETKDRMIAGKVTEKEFASMVGEVYGLVYEANKMGDLLARFRNRSGPVSAAEVEQIAAREKAETAQARGLDPNNPKHKAALDDILMSRFKERGHVFPEHKQTILNGYTATPVEAEKGGRQMPQEFGTGFALAQKLHKLDNNLFWNALPPDAASFYDKAIKEFETNGGNLANAYMTTHRLLRTPEGKAAENTVKSLSGEVFTKAMKRANNIVKEKLDSGFFERWKPFAGRTTKAPDLSSDPYFMDFFRKGMRDRLTENPTGNPEALAETVAQEFTGTHIMVNGQWFNTARLNAKMDDSQMGTLEEALKAVTPWLVGKSPRVASLHSVDDWKNLQVTMDPATASDVAQYRFPNGAYTFSIGGVKVVDDKGVPIVMNPFDLIRQYEGRKFATKEMLGEADATLKAIRKEAADPNGWSLSRQRELAWSLEGHHRLGLVTDPDYRTMMGTLDDWGKAGTEKQALSSPAAKAAEVVQGNAFARSVIQVPLTPEDHGNALSKMNPGSDSATTSLAVQYAARKAQDAEGSAELFAAFMGATRGFYRAASNGRIGYGYDLKQDPEVVLKDLKSAGITPKFTGGFHTLTKGAEKAEAAATKRFVDSLMAGKLTLSREQAMALAQAQYRRVSKEAKAAVDSHSGAAVFDALSPGHRALFAGLHAGRRPDTDFLRALEVLPTGKWERLSEFIPGPATPAWARVLVNGKATANAVAKPPAVRLPTLFPSATDAPFPY